MAARTLNRKNRKRTPAVAVSVATFLIVAAACQDSTGPDVTGPTGQDTVTVLPATGLTESDLSPAGTVVQTDDGFTVDGSLEVAVDDTTTFEFTDANLRVRKDSGGHVTSISGTAEIPPPADRITFEDPVRAQVGFFSGKYLNENGDIGILLDDDTDYFVFDIGVALQMNVATGETGEDAVKPISVKLPVGGRILMVVDYTDPMYYVYGEQDLIGASGVGWSLHGRIPFEPTHQVAGLGTFEARNTRTGSFPVAKIFSVSGQSVDNQSTEVHLTLEDPFASDLGYSYEVGFNGSADLDLGYKDVFGVGIPVASASGGYRYELNTQDIFEGHAYLSGETTSDFSWWPTFLPIKPASELALTAFATSDLDYQIAMQGQYGWEFPDGVQAMAGRFSIEDDRNTWSGDIVDGSDVWTVGGEATKDSTRMYFDPPQSLLDGIASDVNDQVLPRIADAQTAWDDLQQATGDYEFELSLRGLRTQLPGIVDYAKSQLSKGIAAELKKHEGQPYYSQLKSQLYSADNAYYAALDNLKAQALQTTDNAQTRSAIESALRDVAARKIFKTTFKYYVLGVLVKTVNVSVRIMSDAQANQLIDAADDVYRIQETSDIKITMQQIYDQVDDRELFEQVRDDLRDGLLQMRDIGELGLTYANDPGGEYVLYAVIDGVRYEGSPVSALTVVELLKQLPDIMTEALKVD